MADGVTSMSAKEIQEFEKNYGCYIQFGKKDITNVIWVQSIEPYHLKLLSDAHLNQDAVFISFSQGNHDFARAFFNLRDLINVDPNFKFREFHILGEVGVYESNTLYSCIDALNVNETIFHTDQNIYDNAISELNNVSINTNPDLSGLELILATEYVNNANCTIILKSLMPDKLLLFKLTSQIPQEFIDNCTPETLIVIVNNIDVTNLKNYFEKSKLSFTRIGVMKNVDLSIVEQLSDKAKTIDFITDKSVDLQYNTDRFKLVDDINFSYGRINYTLSQTAKRQNDKWSYTDNFTDLIGLYFTDGILTTDIVTTKDEPNDEFIVEIRDEQECLVFIEPEVNPEIIKYLKPNATRILHKKRFDNTQESQHNLLQLKRHLLYNGVNVRSLAIVSLNSVKYIDGLFNIVQTLSETVKSQNIDFLASNIMQSDTWTTYMTNRFSDKEITICASDTLIGKDNWTLNYGIQSPSSTRTNKSMIDLYFTKDIKQYGHYLGDDNWWYIKYHFKSELQKYLVDNNLLDTTITTKRIDIKFIKMLDELCFNFECYCAKLMLTTETTDEYKTASEEVREIIAKIYSILGSKDHMGKNIIIVNNPSKENVSKIFQGAVAKTSHLDDLLRNILDC